jgi:hypothetical protein
MSADKQLQALLHRVTKSAWRWECQGDYAADEAALERWRRGEPDDPLRKVSWLSYIRSLTRDGIPFARVRVLFEPPTEYQRWLIEQTQVNIDAGEDIRWVQRDVSARLGMPTYDFFLLDDTKLVILRFGLDKLLSEIEEIDDPRTVAIHRHHRDQVQRVAYTHADLLDVPRRD